MLSYMEHLYSKFGRPLVVSANFKETGERGRTGFGGGLTAMSDNEEQLDGNI